LKHATGPKAPKQVALEAVPPGLRCTATLKVMGTDLEVSAVLYVEGVTFGPETLSLELRLSEVALRLLDPDSDTPLAALVKSGALDLSKPGNLVAFMPKRPAALVDAADDRLVVDLAKLPKLARSRSFRHLTELVSPLVSVSRVSTDDEEHLDLWLSGFPQGWRSAVEALRGAVSQLIANPPGRDFRIN
jgi:hypothetical protein